MKTKRFYFSIIILTTLGGAAFAEVTHGPSPRPIATDATPGLVLPLNQWESQVLALLADSRYLKSRDEGAQPAWTQWATDVFGAWFPESYSKKVEDPNLGLKYAFKFVNHLTGEDLKAQLTVLGQLRTQLNGMIPKNERLLWTFNQIELAAKVRLGKEVKDVSDARLEYAKKLNAEANAENSKALADASASQAHFNKMTPEIFIHLAKSVLENKNASQIAKNFVADMLQVPRANYSNAIKSMQDWLNSPAALARVPIVTPYRPRATPAPVAVKPTARGGGAATQAASINSGNSLADKKAKLVGLMNANSCNSCHKPTTATIQDGKVGVSRDGNFYGIDEIINAINQNAGQKMGQFANIKPALSALR